MFLELLDVHSYYDKSHILQGVDLQLQQGEMVCLLGRNGVGKTTTLKSVMGMVKPAQGRILLEGRDIVGLLPYQIARLGVGIVPEDRRIFPSLSVHENLLIGMKAGLKLTAEQEKLWGPFEAAVRAVADMRMEHTEEMMARMHDMRAGDDMEKEGGEFGEGMSPVGRLDRLANRLSEAGAALKKVADAAKPLYASLDDSQKHKFGMLGRMLMPERARFAMEMIHHHMGERDDDGAE